MVLEFVFLQISYRTTNLHFIYCKKGFYMNIFVRIKQYFSDLYFYYSVFETNKKKVKKWKEKQRKQQ